MKCASSTVECVSSMHLKAHNILLLNKCIFNHHVQTWYLNIYRILTLWNGRYK